MSVSCFQYTFHWSLLQARLIQSIFPNYIYLSSILILFSDAHLFFQVVAFLGGFAAYHYEHFSSFPNRAARSAHSVVIDLITKNVWRGQPNIKFLVKYFSQLFLFLLLLSLRIVIECVHFTSLSQVNYFTFSEIFRKKICVFVRE